MDRKEFFSAIGFSTAGLMVASCLGSCKKDTAPNVDFTIDISQAPYNVLNTPGNYVYVNGVIVAKTSSGSIIAVSEACTHEGASVQFQNANDRFYCPRHGATFNTSGAVTNGPASSPLKQYTVTINGNSVHVNG